MAGNSEVERRELARQLLIARCELDRAELWTEVGAVGERVQSGMKRASRFLPWVLIVTPAVALLIRRRIHLPRRLPRLAALLVVARTLSRLRPWFPLITSVLRSRRAPANDPAPPSRAATGPG
jgi:hypothetical protein